MKSLDILVVGVGGQGTLLASTILGQLALDKDLDVKLSEVHGMAQRGGSVVTYARMGQKVYAPVVGFGNADIIVAFEKLEALRWLPYLKKGGKMYVNTQQILPMPVITGAREYPQDIEEKLAQNVKSVKYIDALELAKQAGSIKAVNTVLLGFMAKDLEFTKEDWLAAIEKTVKPAFVEMNKIAFAKGYDA